MIYSHTVRTRVTKGATKADMQSFVRGETWDDLMTRIKPSAPPLILYTFFVSVRNLFLLLLYKIFVFINGIYIYQNKYTYMYAKLQVIKCKFNFRI